MVHCSLVTILHFASWADCWFYPFSTLSFYHHLVLILQPSRRHLCSKEVVVGDSPKAPPQEFQWGLCASPPQFTLRLHGWLRVDIDVRRWWLSPMYRLCVLLPRLVFGECSPPILTSRLGQQAAGLVGPAEGWSLAGRCYVWGGVRVVAGAHVRGWGGCHCRWRCNAECSDGSQLVEGRFPPFLPPERPLNSPSTADILAEISWWRGLR
jgi:hypothetical protein